MGEHHPAKLGCALLVCFALALAGCTTKTVGPESPYPDQSTPDHVMEKVEMAYEAMDVDAYVECLAADFVFFLNPDDIAAQPTLPEYWTRAEERAVHEAMFGRGRDIESVSLTLTVMAADSLPGEDPIDPGDDMWEYDTRFDLRIESGLPYFATGQVIFLMGRSARSGRATWQIVEQRDLMLVEEWVQELSLTRAKLIFGDVDPESVYPVRSSPENVLIKLVNAYERMDVDAYLDCLAEDFLFYLNPDDLTANPELPESWDKAEETAIHQNMFGDGTDVEGIELWLEHDSESHDEGDPGDPLDDLWTFREDYDIRVHLPPDLTLWAISPSDFVLQVDPDETGYGGMPLWEILEWYDLPYEWGADGPREDNSWGRIKALYRSGLR
jgi:hypothetical protein